MPFDAQTPDPIYPTVVGQLGNLQIMQRIVKRLEEMKAAGLLIGNDAGSGGGLTAEQAVVAILASDAPTERFLVGLGQYELQTMWVTGHSWQAVDTNATPGARWYQRVARRIGITGTPVNRAQSGRTVCDIAIATLAGTNGWTPRTKSLVAIACTINDITLFDGSAASRRGYGHAWRALLSQFTANAAVASDTATFVYSSGWTASTISTTTGQASNTNATGSKWFRTTTPGSYFEFSCTGDAIDVFLVARAAGAGLATFTVGGSTIATLDLTATVAQDVVAPARLRGLGPGTRTVRCTLTSGASLTVDSYRVPSTSPTSGIVLGEPQVIPTQADHASYLADVTAFKADLAAIVAEYPTFAYVDLAGPGWDVATMLTEDGKHPNDAGCAYIASRCIPALADLPYNRGLNVLGTTAVPTYSIPSAPATPTNGQNGLGAAGGSGPIIPGQVTGLALTPGNAQIAATWDATTNAPSDYVVQYRVQGFSTWSTFADGTSTATSTTITGLTNGTTYEVQVAALNSAGTGTYSSIVTAAPVAPTVPVTSITDDFSGANGALGGRTTTTGNKTWVAGGTAVLGISSGVEKALSGSGQGTLTIDCGSTDGDVQATLVTHSNTATTMISGLILRYVDENNYLSIQIRKGGAQATDRVWSLVARIDNVATILASGASLPAGGDVAKAEMRGNSVRLLVGGVEQIPFTAVPLTASTKHGIYGHGSDLVAAWDLWSYTAVA